MKMSKLITKPVSVSINWIAHKVLGMSIRNGIDDIELSFSGKVEDGPAQISFLMSKDEFVKIKKAIDVMDKMLEDGSSGWVSIDLR